MKSVFYFNRVSKIVIGIVFSLTVLVLVYGIWGCFETIRQTALDRSSAREVTKKLDHDSQMLDLQLAGIAPPATAPDFFTEYRLERDKIRSERTDVLREISQNAKTDEIKNQAQTEILQMTLEKRLESEVENLIKSKGFGDALVFIRTNSVSAVVKSSSLSKEEVIQIADIITKICGTKPEDITVSAKP